MAKSEERSCTIISYVGAAKGSFVEALRYAMDHDLENAQKAFSEGDAAFNEGHRIHMELVSEFAQGKDIGLDILMVHAECQMMSAEDFKTLAAEMIDRIKEK